MELGPVIIQRFYTEDVKKKYFRMILVFKRLADYLTCAEIHNLKTLNSFFHSHMSTPEFVHPLVYRILSILSATKVTEENCTDVYTKLTGQAANLHKVTQNILNYKNLIKNPVGKYQFNHWTVSHGGDGWAVENFLTYPPFKSVYAASYGWGALRATIDLTTLNLNPEINYYFVVGSPVARRWDCESEAKLSIHVLSTNVMIEKKEVYYKPEEGGTSSECIWHWIGLSTKINPEATTIVANFKGKDTRFWAGNYGPRFGYCYAFIVSE